MGVGLQLGFGGVGTHTSVTIFKIEREAREARLNTLMSFLLPGFE